MQSICLDRGSLSENTASWQVRSSTRAGRPVSSPDEFPTQLSPACICDGCFDLSVHASQNALPITGGARITWTHQDALLAAIYGTRISDLRLKRFLEPGSLGLEAPRSQQN